MSTTVDIVSVEFGIPPLSETNQDLVTVIVKDPATGLPMSGQSTVLLESTVSDAIAEVYTEAEWVAP